MAEEIGEGRQMNRNRLALAQRMAAQKYQAAAQMQSSASKSSPYGLSSIVGGLVASASGGGSHGSYGGGGMASGSCFSIDICPDLILAAIAAAGAVAAFLLYQAITVGRKRKKRSDGQDLDTHIGTFFHVKSFLEEFLTIGLEEFEEKIDKIAEGENTGDDSWIAKIYNKFSGYNDVDNALTDEDMDGIEPPMLDETWGLGERTINKNRTVSNFEELPFAVHNRTERAAEVEDELDNSVEAEGEEKCRVQMWRCLSGVIEGGLHYVDSPDGLMGLAKKTMFKMAFHGGFSNIWNSVMTIPEARKVKKCMNVHSDCISYEILRREAQATMDPNDPSYSMYDKKTEEVKEEVREEIHEEVKKEKKKRLIINPEFVQSLDKGDGATQYDEDYKN